MSLGPPWDTILTIITTGVVLKFFDWLMARRRQVADVSQVQAEAAKMTTETALALIGPLRTEVAAARKEAEELRKEVATARTEAEQLRKDLTAARTETDELRRQLDAAKCRIAALEQERSEDAARAMSALMRERDALKGLVTELKARLAETTSAGTGAP